MNDQSRLVANRSGPVWIAVLHWSGPIWIWSGLFNNSNLVGPVPVPVLGLRGQKLDRTGLSNTIDNIVYTDCNGAYPHELFLKISLQENLLF